MLCAPEGHSEVTQAQDEQCHIWKLKDGGSYMMDTLGLPLDINPGEEFTIEPAD